MTDTPAPSETPSPASSQAPLVGVLMGSSSDWETMQHAVQMLQSFGVPHEARVASRHLQGVDSLHSIVQMPKGVPVATFAIGAAGAANAALFAVAMLACRDAALRQKLDAFRAAQTEAARAMKLPPAA